MKAPGKTIGDALAALVRRASKGLPVVGATPHAVAWSENKWRLLHFQPAERKFARPIVIVPSLINRWYVLDLGPGRSLIEWLVARGHEVFCIDWGTPGAEDRYLTYDDIAGRYVGRAIRVAAKVAGTRDAHVLGYCLGGTLVASYVGATGGSGDGGQVASFTALAAPIDFDHAGIMATWTRSPTFDVGALIEAFGNVPWPLMQASFHLLKPTTTAAKLVALADRAWDDEFLETFLATERWGNDNVSFPGACYARYITELYRDNKLVRGGFSLMGRRVDLTKVKTPTLAITFADDHIVPVASALPLVEMVASRDKFHLPMRGGHVGAVVSRKASDRLWPSMAKWWEERDVRGGATGG